MMADRNPAAARPVVVVLDDWEHATCSAPAWQSLRDRIDLRVHAAPLAGEELRAAIAPAQALVLNRDRTPLTRALLDAMPVLERVLHTGPRNRRLDQEALDARGIPVFGTSGGPGLESTCEQTWALILGAMRRLPEQLAWAREGRWRGEAGHMPALLHGKRLGLLGLGEIGTRVANVGRAFGMEIVAWSPNLTPERAAKAGATALPLDELLRSAHVVSLHLVASERTAGLLDAARLALMRPDALLVNTSRPSLVVTADLVSALRAGRPAAAALDVHDIEPLPADDELLALPQVMASPHLGFICDEVLHTLSAGIAQRLDDWLASRA